MLRVPKTPRIGNGNHLNVTPRKSCSNLNDFRDIRCVPIIAPRFSELRHYSEHMAIAGEPRKSRGKASFCALHPRFFEPVRISKLEIHPGRYVGSLQFQF